MPIPAIAAAGASAGGSAGVINAAAAAQSAAIGAGASSFDALGGLGLGIASLILQRRANEQARADQRWYWEQQLPANVMMQRRIAGLSPYGDFPVGSQPSNPVNLSEGMPEAITGMQNSLRHGVDKAFETISQRIALKQLKLEEKRVNNDTLLANANESLIRANVTARNIQNYVDELSKDAKVGINSETWNKLLAEIANLQKDTERQDIFNTDYGKRLDQELENLIRTGNNISADTNLKNANKTRIEGMEQRDVEAWPSILQGIEADAAPFEVLDKALEKLDVKGAKPWVIALTKGFIAIAKAYLMSKRGARSNYSPNQN